MSSLPAEAVDNIGALSFPTGIGPFPWLGAAAPNGWYMLKPGQGFELELIGDYPALAQLVGTRWGGDAITTFAMPQAGFFTRGVDGTHALWAAVGEDTHTLTVNELPAHNHSIDNADGIAAWSGRGGTGTAGATPGTGDRAVIDPIHTTGDVGGGAAHNNVPKTLVVNLIVKA